MQAEIRITKEDGTQVVVVVLPVKHDGENGKYGWSIDGLYDLYGMLETIVNG